MNSDIDIKEFRRRLQKGEKMHVIDVREEWEYEEFNIGSQLIPLNSLPHRLAELTDLINEEIIVHCQNGNRSKQARTFLTSRGFTQVRSLTGGLTIYKDTASS